MSWRALSLLVLISWGALAFGAVYPWAFTPLYLGCAALGLAMLVQRKEAGNVDVPMAGALLLFGIAVGVQLVPLPLSAIRWLSPETDVFLRRYVLGYATAVQHHTLSIAPAATLRALLAGCAFAMLFLGSARTLTANDTVHVARGVAVLGVVMTIAGVVQKAMWNGKIYGFWTPIQSGDSFGPFVNRNHFAGWMLMAVSLTLGYLCARISRSMRHVKPGWQPRLIWLSSSEASETILVGSAVLLMALGLTLTLSRSGILGLLAALVISGWFIARRQGAGSRWSVATVFLVFVALAALWWTGFDRLAARFSDRGGGDIAGRLGIWTDTWRLAERFPLVGTGLNTFRTDMLFYQTDDLSLRFAQAHNDYLQLLAEGGVLLCVPAFIIAMRFVRTVRRQFRQTANDCDYWIRVGAVTGILAIALQELVDFSLQMPGNAALFVILLTLAARHSGSARSTAEPPAAR